MDYNKATAGTYKMAEQYIMFKRVDPRICMLCGFEAKNEQGLKTHMTCQHEKKG